MKRSILTKLINGFTMIPKSPQECDDLDKIISHHAHGTAKTKNRQDTQNTVGGKILIYCLSRLTAEL